jgi:nicotinamide riboside kinase
MGADHNWLSGVPQRLGKALDRVRIERSIETREMTQMCRKWVEDNYSSNESMNVDDKRLTKIIEAAQSKPAIGHAKSIAPWEVEMFDAVFDIPAQCILDHQNGSQVFMASPTTDPVSAKRFKWLFGEAIQGAKELLGWAGFLPCSLEPVQFIRAHHACIFSNMRPEKAAKNAAIFNDIGEHQRKRIVSTLGKRSWDFWHLMFLEDIERLANGSGEYRQIPVETRKECVAGLIDLISDDTNKVHLILARGDEPCLRECFAFLRAFDNVAVIDRRFSFWRDGGRNVYGSWEKNSIQERREELERFRNNAALRIKEDVVSFLGRLCRSIGS